MEHNKFKRIWQHLQYPGFRVRRLFAERELQALAESIAQSERHHQGQIRFVIESHFPLEALWQGMTTQTRAWQWFGELGVWDTEANCGVLVYVSFADHQVEIVADRGIAARVPQQAWQTACDSILAGFRAGEYNRGLGDGLRQITEILQQHYPRGESASNDELPNTVVLR